MDVLRPVIRLACAISWQAIGCSQRWEWSGHLLFCPSLPSKQPKPSSRTPWLPAPPATRLLTVLLLQLPRTCSTRPAPFLPSSVSAGAGASHLIDGKVDKEMTLTLLRLLSASRVWSACKRPFELLLLLLLLPAHDTMQVHHQMIHCGTLYPINPPVCLSF